jgi:hypothetical protein
MGLDNGEDGDGDADASNTMEMDGDGFMMNPSMDDVRQVTFKQEGDDVGSDGSDVVIMEDVANPDPGLTDTHEGVEQQFLIALVSVIQNQ